MSRGQRRRGFTLIEMLTVAVLIGILTAFVAPRIDFTSYRVNGAMRGIGTGMLSAQRLSVTRGYDVVVEFDATGKAVHVLDDANNNGVADAGEHVSSIALGDLIVFGRGAAPSIDGTAGAVTFDQIKGGLPSVTFHRDGSASQAGTVYLTSARAMNQGTANDARAVTVDRATGRVSWYAYNSGTWVRGF
jgi:prepilin-type N-terminal cleavage/methylation domain-containing protein